MAQAYALSGTNLLSFATASPTNIGVTAITGINAGETLVGIDIRPQNGLLYGLGVNATANTATLYAISARTGVAGAIGTPGQIALTTDGATPVDLPDPATVGWGFDFNPAADRIRVVAGSLNFRINPNTGAAVDGDNGGGVVAGVNPDGAISTGTTTVDGAAYTNNIPNNGNVTTLYTIDAASNTMFIQNPPNSGTETLVQAITFGGNPLDFTGVNGFDIPTGVNAAASNTAVVSGSGFGIFTVGGLAQLYSINLVSGQAILVGTVGTGTAPISGLAIDNPIGIPAVALNAAGDTLLRFNTATPSTVTSQAINLVSLAPGEKLVAIDYRPLTGQLYGFAVNAATDAGSLYIVDPQSGALTTVGLQGAITIGADFPDPASHAYGMDFNPAVDRIRITTDTGLNFRLTPNGAVAGVDTPINGLPPGSTGVADIAYTNSYGQASGSITTLYALDAASDSLFIQNPANAGIETSRLAVTLSGGPLDFTAVNGFDIPASVRVTTANAPASGFGYAALTVAGTTSVYQIDLATGAATNLGAVGAGATALSAIALADVPSPPVITSNGAGATANVAVAENTTAVTTVTAVDPDFNPPLTFSIAPGADGTKFQINATTGALSFKVAPDFENPTDTDHNNTYVVHVQASDGTFNDTQTITVSITDVKDVAPAITSNGGGDSAIVAVAENTTAVTTVVATDPEPDTLSYSIVGGADAAKFQIDGTTGALSFVAAPDFDNPSDADHNNNYVVQVQASDGTFTDAQTITVAVTDVSTLVTGTVGDDILVAPNSTDGKMEGLAGVDTAFFDFKLVDATVSYVGNTIVVETASTRTVLTGFEKFSFRDGDVDNLDGDPLVDDLFYYSHNHDVWNAHVDADQHFHSFGFKEDRDPNAFFDMTLYFNLRPGLKASGADPLIDFDQSGWKAGVIPSLNFDPQAYLDANPDVKAAGVDPLAHFLQIGASEGRLPIAPTEYLAPNGFDYVYYLQHNPDVAAAGVDPFEHFQTLGWKEGRRPNELFDTSGYLTVYADVKNAGVNPLDHYHQFGYVEGRDPSADFDTVAYRQAYPDVAAANIDPLAHFLDFGRHEGRLAFGDGAFG